MADNRRHTPEFRGSFVHLVTARKATEDAKAQYSMLVVLDPDDPEHANYLDDLEDWIDETAKAKWGEVPRRLKRPIRDGEEFSDGPEFDGKMCFNAANTRCPGVVDADLEPIDDMDKAEELYSGAWYRASIRPFAWEHKTGGKGVSFSLDNVMKVADDEPLGATAPPPEDDFADMKRGGRKAKRGRSRREEPDPEPRRSRGRKSRRLREAEDDFDDDIY